MLQVSFPSTCKGKVYYFQCYRKGSIFFLHSIDHTAKSSRMSDSPQTVNSGRFEKGVSQTNMTDEEKNTSAVYQLLISKHMGQIDI